MRHLRSLALLAAMYGCVEMQPTPTPRALDCSALPTEYHPLLKSEDGDGYADWVLTPGVHHVEFLVNRASPPFLARAFFHKRATDVCHAEGFSSYTVDAVVSTGSIANVTCAGEKIAPVPLPADPPSECARRQKRLDQLNAQQRALEQKQQREADERDERLKSMREQQQ